jgi:hypothetical protein
VYGYCPPVQCIPVYPMHPYPMSPGWAYPQTYPRGPFPPPRVETGSNAATPTPAPAPGREAAGKRSPVRPAAGSDAVPAPMPPRVGDIEPPRKSDAPMTKPDPLPKFPEVVIPADLGPLPKLELPKGAVGETNKIAPREVAPPPTPVLPPLPTPNGTAKPTAAPPPDFPEPLIPSPSVPVIPDPAKKESLPSLTLPPDVPPRESTSRSSPLTGDRGRASVSVFPVSGRAPAGGYRTVGFYNHTRRDLDLLIEGRAVKLPARNYLYAQLAATFTWGQGNQPPVRETVPAGAAGVDVVFRE